jgi:NAD(P)H-nitrite reductase large subunit
VEWLQGSGVETDWGVIVDDALATSAPDTWAAGDVAETRDRVTGKRYVHAIWPNAVAQARVVAERLLGYDTVYEGAESMNSLRHLGVPLIAVGAKSGDETLRLARHGWLRKIFLDHGRIVGYRLVGEIGGAGLYRSLMLRGVDVSRFGQDLAEPAFGIGQFISTTPELRAGM